MREEDRVRIVFGTKGGRPRDTTVTDREKMLHAVNHALTVATAQNGRLVDRSDLKSAIDRYRNVARKAGLTGKSAPHSLRYALGGGRDGIHTHSGMSENEVSAVVAIFPCKQRFKRLTNHSIFPALLQNQEQGLAS